MRTVLWACLFVLLRALLRWLCDASSPFFKHLEAWEGMGWVGRQGCRYFCIHGRNGGLGVCVEEGVCFRLAWLLVVELKDSE